MPTNVYVDGFNLYYGSLRNYPQLKWLDLAQMCDRLLPGRSINKIRYFTARVKPWPHDPQVVDRQDTYIRALETVPNLSVHLGRFAVRSTSMPRDPLTYLPGQHRPQTVQVTRTEEKRSDVNLATHLLVDCFDNDFDEAILVSNDSDLALPVDVVASRFRKRVGLINPHTRRSISRELVAVTTFQIRSINRSVLANSQFPTTLTDAKGQFHRPLRWR